MPIKLIISVTAIILALVFYTIGVWSERIAGRLKPWHAVMFWIGFVFDTTGTTLMAQLAGKMNFDIHGITGVLAILLMFINAAWATIVLIRKQEKAILNFHKFSLFVWLVWLIPLFTGMIGAMAK
jgi:uncharacterized repeat protein (TIGR03987 family)